MTDATAQATFAAGDAVRPVPDRRAPPRRRALVRSAAQEASLARVTQAFESHRPLVTIDGRPGCGKSTLARAIPGALRLRGDARRTHDGALLTCASLLGWLAARFDLAIDPARLADPHTQETCQTAVAAALRRPLAQRRRPTLLCIDDAHLLPAEVLAMLARFVAIAPDHRAPLCIVLIGRPELARLLTQAAGPDARLPMAAWHLGGLTLPEGRALAARVLADAHPRHPQGDAALMLTAHLLARGLPGPLTLLVGQSARVCARRDRPLDLRELLQAARVQPGAPSPRALGGTLRRLAGAGLPTRRHESGWRWASAAAGIALGLLVAQWAPQALFPEATAAPDPHPVAIAAPLALVSERRLNLPAPTVLAQADRAEAAPAPMPAVEVRSAPALVIERVRSEPQPESATAPARPARPGTPPVERGTAATVRDAAPAPAVRPRPVSAVSDGTSVAAPSPAVAANAPVPSAANAPAPAAAAPKAGASEAAPPMALAMLSPPADAAARVDSRTEARAEPRADARTDGRVEKRPVTPRDDLARAGDALAIGRNTEAIALLRKVLAADPHNHDARTNLVAVLAERESRDEWLQALAEAAAVDPLRWTVTAAQAHTDNGRHEQAGALLRGMPAGGRDLRYLSVAGLVLGRLDQHQASLDAWDRASTLVQAGTARWFSIQAARGVALERLGRADEARTVYEAMLQSDGPAAGVQAFARGRLTAMSATPGR